MRTLSVVFYLGLARGARVDHTKIQKLNVEETAEAAADAGEAGAEKAGHEAGLREWLLEGGHSAERAAAVKAFVDEHWPEGEAPADDRRMKAVQSMRFRDLGDTHVANASEPWQATPPRMPEHFAGGASLLETNESLALSSKCDAHPFCKGEAGDCCPGSDGKYHACCGYRPGTMGEKPPLPEYGVDLPGAELKLTLYAGRFLGPLKATRCRGDGEILGAHDGKKLHDCGGLCEANARCKAFSWMDEKCQLYEQCHTEFSQDSTSLFVKNTEGMTARWLPTKTIQGDSGYFLVIGDWGSESCPQKQSMHYVHKGVQKWSERWNRDHDAQRNVAKVMTDLARKHKPFVVLNAGDNFYWGGTFDHRLGGNDIHDDTSFKKTFEDIYSDSSLKVPWLSVLGNHDFGGDGCMANLGAQFDYTVKDLLHNDRWKMPSPYFSRLTKFDDFSVEFFMIDTNHEDSKSGRAGGICEQSLCKKFSASL